MLLADRIHDALSALPNPGQRSHVRNALYLVTRADLSTCRLRLCESLDSRLYHSVASVDIGEAIVQSLANLQITLAQSKAAWLDVEGEHLDRNLSVVSWIEPDGWVDVDVLWRI